MWALAVVSGIALLMSGAAIAEAVAEFPADCAASDIFALVAGTAIATAIVVSVLSGLCVFQCMQTRGDGGHARLDEQL